MSEDLLAQSYPV